MNVLTVLRILIIGMSIVGLVTWIVVWKRTGEPATIAPISWLVALIGFNIWRFIIKDGTEFHQLVTNYWSAALHISAVILLVTASLLFMDRRLWIWKR